MRHRSFALTLVIALSISAAGMVAHARSTKGGYQEWVNYRFEYQFDLPAGMVPGQEPENGDGRGFTSKDKKLKVWVWGQNNALSYTVAQQYAVNIGELKGAKITYKRIAKNWYVASGVQHSHIFYEKAIYHDGQFDCVVIEYPTRDASHFNPVAAHVAQSFRYVPHKWVENGHNLAGTDPLE